MVDKVTDADLLKGGLGGTDGGTDAGAAGADGGKGSKKDTPKMVKVGNVEVPAEMATYLQPLVDGYAKEIEHLKGQLQTLTVAHIPADKGGKKGAKDDDDDDGYDVNVKLFENPKEALNNVLAKFEKKIAKMIEDSSKSVESRTSAKQQETEFWSEFYKDNPELKEHDFIVRAVLNRDFQKLSTKTVGEAMTHVAQETKKVLLKTAQGGGAGDGKSRGVEGAGGRGSAAGEGSKKEDTDDTSIKADTLSSFLKQRREERRSGKRAS